MRNAFIATTTFYKNVNEMRAQLALRTIEEATRLNYPILIVDGSSEDFKKELKTRNTTVLQEMHLGMGSSRRQVLTQAAELAGDEGVIVWMEPEKWTLVRELHKIIQPVREDCFDLVVPERSSDGMSTYPLEQQHAEQLGNLAFQYLTNRSLDVWFGPFAVNQRALGYFLNYNGEYGDKWDSIFIPRLRIIKDGLRVASILVNYVHPEEQTKEEMGNLAFLVKRIEQLRNLVPALQKEAQKLELYPSQ